MAVTVTYPGVYIEEIPSGVRTITGVATSIAAFVGWAPKGPSDRAQRVLSWADFDRLYGGLDARSLLGYGVYHFFNNGGQQAYIVRLTGEGAEAGTADVAPLTITAKSPGEWSDNYGVRIKRRAAPDDNRFRLEVVWVKPGTEPAGAVPVETFENLSVVVGDRRNAKTLIDAESNLINVAIEEGATDPPEDTAAGEASMLDGGADGEVLTPGTDEFGAVLLPEDGVSGVHLLDRIDLFNLLCVPGESTPATLGTLEAFCKEHRAMLIADPAEDDDFDDMAEDEPPNERPAGPMTGDAATNGALYFPWVIAQDPLQENRARKFPPSGFVAGIYARTDTTRGVWKAPAGTEASLTGVIGVTVPLTDRENGVLNIKAINCIRSFAVYGTVVWGARTLHGNNERGSEWKYIPVRRVALFIEESLYRGTKWVVFEPNDEPLWAQIRLNVGAFMHDLFVKGAFQGSTPKDAYFVKCDKETTTQNDINRGIVNIVVGFAPLKPAEFVVIKIQQIAGNILT